jgi:hypothetical protein
MKGAMSAREIHRAPDSTSDRCSPHPCDEDLSPGTPDLHPCDEDLSPGTPDLHPCDEDLSPGTPDPAGRVDFIAAVPRYIYSRSAINASKP